MKDVWKGELAAWQGQDLTGKDYVYFWADGIHFHVRMDEARQCILVIIGATEDGPEELVSVWDGWRESAQSWKELLLDLKRRGLKIGPRLAVGDRALGFWSALLQIYGETRRQRCWCHKAANVLNKMAKGVQRKANKHLQDIWMAETKKDAEEAFDYFIEAYGVKYPKAAECLKKDRETLLTFCDFPAEHWAHLRTTNPIESTFATVRLRTAKNQGLSLPCNGHDDGLPVSAVRRKELATTQRIGASGRGYSGSHVR